MKCPSCDIENREGAKFCRNCGSLLVRDVLAEEPLEIPAAKSLADEDAVPSIVLDDVLAADEVVEAPDGSEEALLDGDKEPLPASEDDAALDKGGDVVPDEEIDAEPEAELDGGDGPAADEEEVDSVEVDTHLVPDVVDAAQIPVEETEEGAVEPVDMVTPGGEEAEVAEAEIEDTLLEPEEGDLLPEEDDDRILGFWRTELEPLECLEPDTVIGDRYAIAEVLDIEDEQILYVAHDLRRCWQCAYEGNAVSDAFCARCGVALDRKPEIRLLQVRNQDVEPPVGMRVSGRLAEGERAFLVIDHADQVEKATAAPPSIRLRVGQRSHTGQIRDLDEDSMLAFTLTPTFEARTSPVFGLYAVADGMGGHEGGELASKLALQVLAEQVLNNIILPELSGQLALEEDILVRLRQATIAANDAVFLDSQKRENDMGTTLTAALIRDDRLFLSHVGDCRAYRYNAGGLEQLTTDHSVIASMIASGQAQPDEIYTHPHRSVIYRCIGDKPVVEVDTDIFPLQPNDRIILCSDGLWEMVRNEGIEDGLLRESDAQAACELLVNHANMAGGDDNISVIIVQFETI